MPHPILTGTVFQDNDADGVFGAGDVGLAGVTVTLTGNQFGGSVSDISDASGGYTIDMQTLVDLGNLDAFIVAATSTDWVYSGPPGLGTNVNVSNTVDVAFTSRCCRPASSWPVTKICYIAGQGVQVTFQDKKGPYTALFPTLTLGDKEFLCACGCPGHMLLTAYKGMQQQPTTTSL